MTLTFDEATHTYRLGGMVVPGVTTALGPLQPDYSYATTETGSAVHKLTELWDMQALTECLEVPDAHMRYLDAWCAFREDHDFYPSHIEERVHHSLHRYAGTVDRIGAWHKDEPVILDIKTGAPAAWHGCQLAAYVMAAERLGIVKADITRIGVYLSDDGTYRIKEYTDPKDGAAFLAALYLTNWKASHA